ncbi:MAG: hypothetical protein OEV42_16415 [Deltaproteobacteria bacterium]|nr:hypothetical protein [Deltaproteobacteria bacterium]
MKIVQLLCLGMCIFLFACEAHKKGLVQKDSKARSYRMYYDGASANDNSELQVRKFRGQLRMASLENIFGDFKKLPEDKNKNRVGGWKVQDDLLWSLVASPSLKALNVMTIGVDGTFSSAIDLDGDSMADIVDIRLGDGSRFSFVTEFPGREFFELWLTGRNPLCSDRTIAGISLSAFGCDEGDSGSSGGGSADLSGGAAIYDPFDHICDGYSRGGTGLRPPVMAHGGHGYGRMRPWSWRTGNHDNGQLRYTEGMAIYEDAEGNHVATIKELTFYNEEGDVVRVIHERVEHDGQGTRTITDHGADGTTKTHSERFETEVEDDGTYGGEPTDHEHAPPSERDSSSSTPPADVNSGGSTTNPGPGDPNDPTGTMAEWCANRGDFVSGVEQASDRDPTSFHIDCDDLVTRTSTNPGDCTIIDWAGPEDFTGATDAPSAATGCGPFEQPGPDGTCGPASGIQRLRGSAAWVGSIDLQTVEICNPLVCNPNF